ncbi:hypothetical protein A5634_11455 [Mycobacterium asiaticum]|uniref:Uncharacterized protein n=1 Tax=Mycobacterium asiaticum TaxID=1790 RepID=A0A1A3NFK8_MYCAS|nr:hypothetical protein [Mycobacterium asiaticum]OBK20918.1 hypothetical protein A5634_11455 [Mycobacterium asiaticum]
MITTRLFAAGVILSGAAVSLAGPASAEPLGGSYTATMIEGPMVGLHHPINFTSCGSNCTLMGSVELHPQGDNWTGTMVLSYGPCAVSLNAQTLILDECGAKYQLTKD